MASYHETWEKSLQSILSDTETNIASLKKNMTPKFESTPYIPRQMAYGINDGISGSFSPRASKFAPIPKPFLEYQRPSSDLNEVTQSTITSFSKRVQQLEQLTSTLNNSVTTLKYENKVQSEEIKKMKDEIKHLTKRLHEKGVDLATEQKLKRWQKEVKSDMETIKSLLNTRSKADQYHGLNDITTISLSKDISDSKRLLLEEADLLRRECDNMSTRILKLENEFAVVNGESKDLGMRHVRLEKDMISVNENYRSQSRIFSNIERENARLRDAVEDMRHEIEGIQYDLKRVSKPDLKQTKNLHSKGGSSKEPPKAKDFSHCRKPEKDVEQGKSHSNESEINSFENSFDISIVSSDFDDLSLNTSLNLSDEIDPLKSF